MKENEIKENKEIEERDFDENTPAILIQDLHKSYGKKEVLKGLNLEVKQGELFGFIGRNGAGKSTLMKIIAGIEQESSGELFMGDEKVHFDSVGDARKYGIGIIHQELRLFPNLTVYQNIFMGREITKKPIGLDNKAHIEKTKKIMEKPRYIEGAKVFFVGRNRLTFTGYKGYDPEVDSDHTLGNYPNTLQIAFGAELTF